MWGGPEPRGVEGWEQAVVCRAGRLPQLEQGEPFPALNPEWACAGAGAGRGEQRACERVSGTGTHLPAALRAVGRVPRAR